MSIWYSIYKPRPINKTAADVILSGEDEHSAPAIPREELPLENGCFFCGKEMDENEMVTGTIIFDEEGKKTKNFSPSHPECVEKFKKEYPYFNITNIIPINLNKEGRLPLYLLKYRRKAK